ncbi:MAG: hypothetical protein JWR52_183 [Marmoricola sp.]|nr:hypothetical protein [Marmoricola sp.]
MTAPMVNLALYDERDLPVLRAVVARLETNRPPVMTQHVAEELGIDQAVAARTLSRLIGAGLLDGTDVSSFEGEDYFVQGVPLAGLEVSGAWPTAETAVDRLIRALQAEADSAAGVDGSRLQAAIDTLKTLSHDTVVAVGASIITGAMR